MSTVDIVGLLIPVTYFVFLAVETLWPAREFPARRGWQWVGIAFLLVVGTLSTVVPLLIPSAWLERHRLLDGTGLGVVGGTVAGYFVLSGLSYAVHRTVHNVPALWRLSMHHFMRCDADVARDVGHQLLDLPAAVGPGGAQVLLADPSGNFVELFQPAGG